MAEWSKATVSKIVVGATSPRVQIPLSPPYKKYAQHLLRFFYGCERGIGAKRFFVLRSLRLQRPEPSVGDSMEKLQFEIQTAISPYLHARVDGKLEFAALRALTRPRQIPLSPPFFAKKWRNEDASLLFTVRSTTSLKRRSLFFTSSPNSRRPACLSRHSFSDGG